VLTREVRLRQRNRFKLDERSKPVDPRSPGASSTMTIRSALALLRLGRTLEPDEAGLARVSSRSFRSPLATVK
jgi:hypothetical protein